MKKEIKVKMVSHLKKLGWHFGIGDAGLLFEILGDQPLEPENPNSYKAWNRKLNAQGWESNETDLWLSHNAATGRDIMLSPLFIIQLKIQIRDAHDKISECVRKSLTIKEIKNLQAKA